MRSLDKQVADLDSGIRARIKARANPRRQVVPNKRVHADKPAAPVPTKQTRAIDWTHAPIAQFVKQKPRVSLLSVANDDEPLPAFRSEIPQTTSPCLRSAPTWQLLT